VRLQGSYPLDGNSSATLSAQGPVNVGIVRIFQPDTTGAGTLPLDIHASGTAKNPAVQGQIQLKDVAFSTPTAPLGVQKLNGTLAINNDSIHLSNVAGEVGGGQLSMGEPISYRPNLQFNLTMQSTSVRLLYPDGLRTVLDGNLLLSGTKDAATLNGRVLIDSLSFTPDFDLAKFAGQFGGATVPSQPGLADNIKLAVGVQSKRKSQREQLSADDCGGGEPAAYWYGCESGHHWADESHVWRTLLPQRSLSNRPGNYYLRQPE
jgi:hypothetical protein